MSIEKRRSDRIMFTIPLTIRGRDPEGKPYEADARTIGVNRHGARIQAACPLQAGQTIHIHNDLSQGEADFRVVGPVYPPTDRVGEWGVECTDEKKKRANSNDKFIYAVIVPKLKFYGSLGIAALQSMLSVLLGEMGR